MHYSILCIASEQLFPHIEAVLHYKNSKPGLQSVVILHSSSEKSKKPAMQLERLLNQIFANQNVKVYCIETEIATQAVTLAAESEIRRYGDSHEWIVNATGGLKMMAFGLVNLLHHPTVTLIYLDTGQWWRISRDKESASLRSDPLAISGLSNTEVNIVDFLRAQDLVHPGFQLDCNAADFYQPPEGVALPSLLRSVADLQWRWNDPSLPFLGKEQRPGFAFERFLGAFLFEIGITNLVGNLVPILAGTSGNSEENDIFVLWNRKIYFIDISLALEGELNKSSAITQINDAVARAKNFAGSQAGCLIIRPREQWSTIESISAVATAKDAIIIDSSYCFTDDGCRFFRKLASIFTGIQNHPLPGQLDLVLSDSASQGQGIFSAQKQGLPPQDPSEPLLNYLKFQWIKDSYFKERNMPVLILEIGNSFFVWWRDRPFDAPATRVVLEKHLNKLCRGFKDHVALRCRETGCNIRFLDLPDSCATQIRQWLRSISQKTLQDLTGTPENSRTISKATTSSASRPTFQIGHPVKTRRKFSALPNKREFQILGPDAIWIDASVKNGEIADIPFGIIVDSLLVAFPSTISFEPVGLPAEASITDLQKPIA